MKNWKTTLGGILGSVGIALTASANPTVHIVGLGICASASIWFGWHAADKS